LLVLTALFAGACSDSASEPTPAPQPEAAPVSAEAQVSALLPEGPVAAVPQTPAAAFPEPEKTQPEQAVTQPAPQKVSSLIKPAPQTLSEEEIIRLFKQWDENLNTLETYFHQLSSYDGVEISRSQGNLYYDKKNPMLRLDTLTLDGTISQTALTDKKTILILDDQNQPITTLSWQEWQQGQPNQALFDFGNYSALLERHNVAVQERTPVNTVLVLTPKEGEPYQLYLTLDNHDYFPSEIKITADLITTTADLSDTRKNTTLDTATLFGGFTQK